MKWLEVKHWFIPNAFDDNIKIEVRFKRKREDWTIIMTQTQARNLITKLEMVL